MKQLVLVLTLAIGFAMPLACATNHTAACADSWLDYEPALVELHGVISSQEVFGPPGFGENPSTDRKHTIYVVSLARGINVKGRASDTLNATSFKCVTRIQIVFPDDPGVLKALVGRRVTVRGALFQRTTGHHYTDVLINATTVKPEMRT